MDCGILNQGAGFEGKSEGWFLNCLSTPGAEIEVRSEIRGLPGGTQDMIRRAAPAPPCPLPGFAVDGGMCV